MRSSLHRTLIGLVLSAVAGCGGSDDASAIFEEADTSSVPADSMTDETVSETSVGGDAISNSDDAMGTDSPPAEDAVVDSGCTLSFYKDEDGDGTGGATKVTACAAPAGHVATTGDCRDDNKDVRPGATEYRTVGYASTAPISPTSFDYNCNNNEERDPTKAIAGSGGCAVAGLGCSGEGYLPTTAMRSGPGVDNHCGSTRFRKCERRTVPPSCTASEIVAPTPMGCR